MRTLPHAPRAFLNRLVIAVLVFTGWLSGQTKSAWCDEPRFQGLGSHTRKVSTQSDDAQRFFDQGLAFLFAFNHDEAIRSFTQSAAIDPRCAMAYWGIAAADGPHINNPIVDEAHAKAAWSALTKA